MKLNIGSGHVHSASDIEAFTLYDDAAIDLARHGVMSKAHRQARGKAGTGESRARRNKSRGDRDGRALGRHDGR